MGSKFDAQAEAARIGQLAKDTLDNAGADLYSTKAMDSEQALANELASVWADPSKAVPVAKELQKLNDKWFSAVPSFNVRLENDPKNGWQLGDRMRMEPGSMSNARGAMEAVRQGDNITVTVVENVFPPHPSISATAKIPERLE